MCVCVCLCVLSVSVCFCTISVFKQGLTGVSFFLVSSIHNNPKINVGTNSQNVWNRNWYPSISFDLSVCLCFVMSVRFPRGSGVCLRVDGWAKQKTAEKSGCDKGEFLPKKNSRFMNLSVRKSVVWLWIQHQNGNKKREKQILKKINQKTNLKIIKDINKRERERERNAERNNLIISQYCIGGKKE